MPNFFISHLWSLFFITSTTSTSTPKSFLAGFLFEGELLTPMNWIPLSRNVSHVFFIVMLPSLSFASTCYSGMLVKYVKTSVYLNSNLILLSNSTKNLPVELHDLCTRPNVGMSCTMIDGSPHTP
jgi:hypothetical protein